MHVQEVTDTVSGSMQEVDIPFPDVLPSQYVELCAAGSDGENSSGKSDHALQEAGIVNFIAFRSLVIQGKCTGYIGGSIKVLAAGVCQQDAVFSNGIGAFRADFVMYDGSMVLVTNNGAEAVACIMALLSAKIGNPFTDGPFGNGVVAFSQLFFKLFPKASQCDAIFNHGISETCDFSIVFERFHSGYG